MWEQQEAPDDDLRLLVTGWVWSRYDDPYDGVRRTPDMPDLWFGTVPWTDTPDGRVVVCAYWIDELNRVVTCSSIATLSRPI